MTEPITGWIWGRNLRALLELQSHCTGYVFDETDNSTGAVSAVKPFRLSVGATQSCPAGADR
ncbi:hypothetical protein [Streptomyces sp. NBC_01334]|uniref:hypothetical protein n=1 Tax=Streptomyces sp. NBC_01334 TaxID=2903827 RepID=UPI002E1126DE|nr:hypothetical protein OG736_44590 [Streptomyces sp. NBC_01334]